MYFVSMPLQNVSDEMLRNSTYAVYHNVLSDAFRVQLFIQLPTQNHIQIILDNHYTLTAKDPKQQGLKGSLGPEIMKNHYKIIKHRYKIIQNALKHIKRLFKSI